MGAELLLVGRSEGLRVRRSSREQAVWEGSTCNLRTQAAQVDALACRKTCMVSPRCFSAAVKISAGSSSWQARGVWSGAGGGTTFCQHSRAQHTPCDETCFCSSWQYPNTTQSALTQLPLGQVVLP